MKYIIDRLEEGLAVLEDELREHITVALSDLPDGASEGDVLDETDHHFLLDEQATNERREAIRKRLKKLFE